MLVVASAKAAAAPPATKMASRTIRRISACPAAGRKIGRYTFQTNIDEAERKDESIDDMTAAAIAPRPTAATSGGVRFRSK